MMKEIKLFIEFIRFIKIIKPEGFFMENVAQVLTKGNGNVKKLELFSQDKYYIDNKILLAYDYVSASKTQKKFFYWY